MDWIANIFIETFARNNNGTQINSCRLSKL